MPLVTLPNEILCLLPLYIDNIESFTNAASSCRRLRDTFYTAHPNTILRLAVASAPTFFSPHPHFLIAATVRQASNWALGDASRTKELRRALQGGINSLLDFSIQYSGLSLPQIRSMHQSRFSILNPLSDLIDKMAGSQWYATPEFWNGGVSEPYTLDTEASRATFQIVIYGELFGPSMLAFLEPERADLPFFDVHTRLDYFTYCVPDWVCKSYPGFEVLPTGPYALDVEPPREGDQVALHYILRCGRWRRLWTASILEIMTFLGEEQTNKDSNMENEESWREKMLRDALLCQGLEGMQLVTVPEEKVDKDVMQRFRWIKKHIDKLERPPSVERLGKGGSTLVSHAPDPSNEVEVPCRDMWP
ncbi:hypothetical protein EYZ11_005453 [Aspergillus tanneri]|uniref:F-box domain-containing protein n=1 Tax=Aspergillus tanneri TaxID=1220188 RepID=A0A4S3JKC9_9EURO|nr:hypothetical protein EYZ11_005453 [Aspergillus tanneri]